METKLCPADQGVAVALYEMFYAFTPLISCLKLKFYHLIFISSKQ